MEIGKRQSEQYPLSDKERAELKSEVEAYRRSLENGEYPELPFDISLRVELAEIDYDPEQYTQINSVYSNREIKSALLDGHIRIFPYREENLNGTSYDVTLGDYFYLTDRVNNRSLYNPRSRQDTERYFEGPYRAIENSEWCQKQFGDSYAVSPGDMQLYNIPGEALVMVLNPGERVLAHTWEFIGINGPGTTQMQARSTYGRNGIVVCKDAGWGDPGYRNRWTMEVQNDNKERVPLVVGDRPAQIVFYSSGMVEGSYGEAGKYYATSSLVEDIQQWQPESMLPRGYKDAYKEPISLQAGLEVKLRDERNS